MLREKIRLLKFVTCFNIGGTERQVTYLARSLDPERFELHLACLRRTGELLPEIESCCNPVEFGTNRLTSWRTLRQQLRLARYLRKHRIQIVHPYGFYANVFAIPPARLAGCKTIASIRDTGDHLTRPQKIALRAVCRLADCVLANSEAIRQQLLSEQYRAARLAVIPNGIDLSRFWNPRRSPGLRASLGIPSESPLVMVLSRLTPLKGIEYFLKAAVAVGRHLECARFLIAGDGPCRAELEAFAKKQGLNGRVIFTGFRVDVPEILAETDVSVLPSLSEGLSNTLLESMAAGAAVIATSVGGNVEVVEHGVTGLLVPPKDPEALAEAIVRLLENPELARGMAEAGRQRVFERFSAERMVTQTERLYASLLASAGEDGETPLCARAA